MLVAGIGASLVAGTLGALAAGVGATEAPAGLVVPQFVEVTASSGIAFRHISGPVDHKRYLFETKGGGIGAFDYDNDGWMDLYIAQGSTLERVREGRNPHGVLLRNRGDWTFEDVTEEAGLTRGAWGMGVSAADVDNDGFVDVYLTNLGPNVLFRNNGDGTFTDISATAGVADPRWSASAPFGDYDGDGRLDLFVVNYLDVGPDNLPAESERCRYRGVRCACGPIGLRGAADTLYRQGADGTFVEVTAEAGILDQRYPGLGAAWGDVDDDGDLDLYVTNDSTPNELYVNGGEGRFTESGFPSGLAVGGMGSEQASMGVDLADFDNDGRLDAYCTHFAADYSTLYRNEGSLLFRDVTAPARIQAMEYPLVSWGTRFVDLNHDGWKDIFHANGHVYPFMENRPFGDETFRQPHSLYLNLADGTFLDASTLAGPDIQKPALGRGVAFADFDNDGDVDLAVANMNGAPQLFRNDLPAGQHWVTFRAVGRESNRDGLGARVTVTTGELRQVWEIKRTVAVYSCSDPRAHFGLGKADRVDAVRVRWPSGKVQEFRDVPGDRHYVVDEESGLRAVPPPPAPSTGDSPDG
ncbi:MAG: CRTAC1 family protein [Acidobacteria bacterium]|nr:CRTAC1 family protein [Acidobacteriota bacterium]